MPPEVAKVTSVLAPSIFSALMPRKLRPGLLRAAVSAVTRKVAAVEKAPLIRSFAALRP